MFANGDHCGAHCLCINLFRGMMFLRLLTIPQVLTKQKHNKCFGVLTEPTVCRVRLALVAVGTCTHDQAQT